MSARFSQSTEPLSRPVSPQTGSLTPSRDDDHEPRVGPVSQRGRLGFTLVELMIVVTIIAILAAIGSFAYGRLTKRSRINEAITFFAAVEAAQVTYLDLMGQYCATDTDGPPDAFDPLAADIAARSHNWTAPLANWQICGVSLPRNTWFQYLLIAGEPADICADPAGLTGFACASVTNGTFWYYVIGRADQDGDGTMSAFGSSSVLRQDHWALPDVELE